MQSPSLYHGPNQSPDRRTISPWRGNSQEAYYSNHDIGILHDLVATAQRQLETACDPKPLPAAALFRAYDEVLPKHGIDPDSDHHLSAILFRIGGEQGDDTLSQKFQTILGRMGIVLEFDENSSHSISDAELERRSTEYNPPLISSNTSRGAWLHATEGQATPALSRPESPLVAQTTYQYTGKQNLTYSIRDTETKREASEEVIVSSTSNSVKATMLPHELESATNKSKGGSGSREIHKLVDSSGGRRISENGEIDVGEAMSSPRVVLSHPQGWRNTTAINMEQNRDTQNITTKGRRDSEHVEVAQTTNEQNTIPTIRTATGHIEASCDGLLFANRTDDENPDEEESRLVLLGRASRARKIYLASKAFNGWAERTACRLEREAVATRHMIRFRCFQGWSRTPASRIPASEHLRTLTAVEKLRRAIAWQGQQLRAAAHDIDVAYKLNLATTCFDNWRAKWLRKNAQEMKASRIRATILVWWTERVTKIKETKKGAVSSGLHFQKLRVVSGWRMRAQANEQQAKGDRLLGIVRPLLRQLGTWQLCTEAGHRAKVYVEHRLLLKSFRLLTDWGLQARQQAYIWHLQYFNVRRGFIGWKQRARHDHIRRVDALRYLKRESLSQTLACFRVIGSRLSTLVLYKTHACLYIRAARFLLALDLAAERKRNSQREELRNQLMVRYKETSASRKRRQFRQSLERWNIIANYANAAKSSVTVLLHEDASRTAMELVSIFKRAASHERQAIIASHHHRIDSWLDLWSDNMSRSKRQLLFMRQDLASKHRQRFLRNWTKSSLQGSGQKHTASMVRQRHLNEGRNRVFRSWRFLSSRSSTSKLDTTHPRSKLARSVPIVRNDWRMNTTQQLGIQSRLPHATSSADMMATPTRWTGRPMPMSNLLSANTMPAVNETDEDVLSATTSDEESNRNVMRKAALFQLQSEKYMNPPRLRHQQSKSTTPLAPIPSYLLPPRQIEHENLPSQHLMHLLRHKDTKSMVDLPSSPPLSIPHRRSEV